MAGGRGSASNCLQISKPTCQIHPSNLRHEDDLIQDKTYPHLPTSVKKISQKPMDSSRFHAPSAATVYVSAVTSPGGNSSVNVIVSAAPFSNGWEFCTTRGASS